MRSGPLTASNVLTHAKTRTALRDFILSELPGWDPWLTLAAAEIQRKGHDEQLLKTERDLVRDVTTFAEEFAASLGPDAERFFMPFMQRRPDYPLEREHAASEPFTRSPGDLPFSHADLGDKLPSRVLIGLVGALGLRRHQVATGNRKDGRNANLRMAAALDWVCADFHAFIDAPALPDLNVETTVAPQPHLRDPSVPETALRRAPPSISLAAVVAVYLSLPNRNDPDAPEDPEQLELPANCLKDTLDRLRQHLNEHRQAHAAREKLNTALDDPPFPDEH